MKIIAWIYGIILVCVANATQAQEIVREFRASDVDSVRLNWLRAEFGQNKTIPKEIEAQTLIALSYFPELKDIKIEFKFKKSNSPLKSKPDLLGTFFRKASKRKYLVIISSKPLLFLEHVRFSVLDFNPQIGVLGHEISHVVDFKNRNMWGILGMGMSNLSNRRLDDLEFNTDRKTIDYGLGFQLLAWSKAVRDSSKVKKYLESLQIEEGQMVELQENERQRYMNPKTIDRILRVHPLYKDFFRREVYQ